MGRCTSPHPATPPLLQALAGRTVQGPPRPPQIHGQQYLRFFVAHIRPPAGKVVIPVHTQQGRQGLRTDPPLLHRPPAQKGSRVAHGAHGMARIQLAIAECPFAILPGLAPHHGAQADRQCRPRGKRLYMARAQLQRMLVRQVVVKPVSQPRHTRKQHIGLNRMQVATGRVGPHGPTVRPQGLPGGQAKGKMQERPQACQIRHCRAGRRLCKGLGTGQGQGKYRRTRKTAKGLGPGIPIQGCGAGRVGREAMLGPLLIDLHHLPGGECVGGRDRR